MRTIPSRDGASLADSSRLAARHRRRPEPSSVLAAAAAASVVVALADETTTVAGPVLTFLVFLLVGATLDRRSRWSAMLPFTRVVVGLLSHVVAVALAGVLTEATTASSTSVAAGVLTAAAAAATAALTRRAAARASTRIAVLGGRHSGEQLRTELLGTRRAGHEVVGVITAGALDTATLRCSSVPVLGHVTALAELLEHHPVDLLLIDGEAAQIAVFDALVDTCLDAPVRVCELSQFYEDSLGHVPVNEISSAWFRYIMHPRFRSPNPAAKRGLDIVIALIAGVAFLPVLCLCAVLVRLQDGGPVLFRQRRIGERGREFTLIKLRTMCAAAPQPRWSCADDERVTPIGRMLRRAHLDEVPQLLNVLRGEMSVVGPRPEQPQFVERLEATLPHYSRRHLIKPGLTGWAQVRCGYAGSDAGSEWKLCHDLFYLKHRSLGLDLAILVETARTLVADRQYPESERAPRAPARPAAPNPALGASEPQVAMAAHGAQDAAGRPLGMVRARRLIR